MPANQVLLDALVRHQIHLHRYSTGEVKRIVKLLEQADADLVLRLRARVARLRGSPALDTQRAKDLLKAIRELRAEAMRTVRKRINEDLGQLAKVESKQTVGILSESMPAAVEMVAPALPQLRAAIKLRPFADGTTVGQMMKRFEAADQRRITQAVQMGIVQGEPVDDIVRRLVGTRARRYADGVLAVTRRDATAVVRTAINHASNTAREEVFEANADVIHALRVVATLDGRTTPICRALDGAMSPIGSSKLPRGAKRLMPPGRRPPFHMGCRTVMVATIDPDGLADKMGSRPMVRDTRTRRLREMDFRAEAKEAAGGRWSNMSAQERNAAVSARRRAWTSENVGHVPADTTYQAWLKTQPAAFQDDVLGKAKAALFRRGGLKLDQFIDRTGAEYSLADLARQHPAAFMEANLDPGEFQ